MGYVIPVSEMIKTNSERLSDLPSVTQLINNIKKMNPSLSVSRVYLLSTKPHGHSLQNQGVLNLLRVLRYPNSCGVFRKTRCGGRKATSGWVARRGLQGKEVLSRAEMH